MTLWPNGSPHEPDVTSGWGWYVVDGVRKWHYGADLINFEYNCSPEAGTVVYAERNGDAGLDIRIASGIDGTIFRMLHNDEFYVGFGDYVAEGQAVGLQGTSGGVGKHCHFEVWPGGNINNRVDPLPWMRARIGSRPAGGGTEPFTSKRRNDMATLYYRIGSNPPEWALGGDSPGTPANWLPIGDSTVATSMALAHGSSVQLGNASWADFKAKYQSPVSTKAVA